MNIEAMERWLRACRDGYQEAKIAHNEGRITAAQLEGIRLKIEALEAAAAKLRAH
jgi:hypothetical protein